MTESDRQQAVWYSLARVGFGVIFTAAPVMLKRWIGPDAARPGTKVIGRAFGARDLAMGTAAYMAISAGDSEGAKRMLQLCAACDAVDAAATALSLRAIPKPGAFMSLAFASAAAGTGFALARRL